MKYVACYTRVSTDEQKKFGFSIQAQKDALEKYCKENQYKYEFYTDEGISASSMKRPALQEMLRKVNVFDMILFTKLDRLSRNVLDANNINKLLLENHCTMKAIDEDDIDTSTADGTFIFNLKVSLAQREIGKTSERINFVFNNKREKGEITSGTKKYGYDIVDKHYVVNPSEAQNIVNLYHYFISVGGDVQKTYKYFVLHFPNKSYDSMRSYLKNTSYIGKYQLYKKDTYLDNYIPRIIDDATFYTAQNLIKKRGRIRSEIQITPLFIGLIYCSHCQSQMGKHQDNRPKVPKVRYSCWRVYTKQLGEMQNKCDNSISAREEYIEGYLLNNLKDLAKDYINKNTIISTAPAKDNSKEIKQLRNKLYKLKDLYLSDLIDRDMYEKDYTDIQKQIKELEEQQVAIEKKDYSELEKFIQKDIVSIYNKLNKEEKRTFWISLIDKIYVDERKN